MGGTFARGAFATVVLAVMAGCASGGPGHSASPTQIDAPPRLASVTFDCPAGGTTGPGAEVCVTTIFRQTESLQEPYLAIDPNRPNVMAVGVNSGHRTDNVKPAGAGAHVDGVQLDIYFTEDAGQTWRLSVLPNPELPAGSTPINNRNSGDPALVFDEHGTLHVSGIARTDGSGSWQVYYTSTVDLGKTWSKPVVVSTGEGHDRNWINLGPNGTLYIPWQIVGSASAIAWSLDRGATWNSTGEDSWIPDCITISVAVLVDDTPVVACSMVGERSITGVLVARFHPGNGTFETLATLDDFKGPWPKLAKLPNGTLILSLEPSAGGTIVSMSHDEGRTWTPKKDLRKAAKIEDAWDGTRTFWMEADPWGTVHFLLWGNAAGSLPAGPSEPQLAHVVLDPGAGTIVAETLLSREVPLSPPTRVPPSIGGDFGDHYYGIAFTPERTYLAWTRERGIDVATAKSVFAA